MLQVGEYKSGSDPVADEAIKKIGNINKFLRQPPGEPATYDNTLKTLKGLVS